MARPVTIMLNHDLGKEEARRRVVEATGKVHDAAAKASFKISEEWDGDRLAFTAKGLGQNITGDLDVFEQHVRIVVMLPGLLAGLAETIVGRVEKEGQILLEKK